MWSYILRRILYAVPILICVNIITFFLFFFVNTPDDVAYTILGQKHVRPSDVYRWKREHNYHFPMMLNLKDRIFYINDITSVPDDVRETLKDYKIMLCRLDKDSVKNEVDILNSERNAKPDQDQGTALGYSDGFKRIVDRVSEEMNGDEIILVDYQDITAEQASILVSGFLDKGVPFIVLNRDEKEIIEQFDMPVITYHAVRADHKQEDLKELKDFIDVQQATGMGIFTNTLFYTKSVRLFWFDFGKSDRENIDISFQVISRMGASLMITVPAFILGIALNIFIAMIVAFCRGTYVDRTVAVVCIIIMSILSLFYYFSSQLVFGTWLKVFPISGYIPGFSAIRFILLPLIVTIFMGIGGGVRFYRTIFLEEVNREYVRTARSKGLNELAVLFKHVLKNAMIPILTNVVMVLPMLFMGSLILESFFGIPGLGGFTLEGIQAQDFRIVGSMVYLGAFLYIAGLIMTDISYTLVDPRVRFE